MKVVGVITEYNPFHDGHAYFLEQAKKVTGADFAVSIMNGDFVQRGEPAIVDKYTRTRMALEGGSDMVFELPVRFGISSARDFALGSILALQSLGFVTDICFGSECGELEPIQEAADYLYREPADYAKRLQENLKEGLPYPAAVEKALQATAHCASHLLHKPNNILSVQYCLALQELNSNIVPHTIKRYGQGYHDDTDNGNKLFPSSTALRKKMREAGEKYLCLDDFSDMIGYALCREKELHQYKDISPDLADRLESLLDTYRSASDYANACQAKNYTAGRIRRSMVQCLLGVKNSPLILPYLRFLGMKKEASFLLRQCENTSAFQIISRLAVDLPKVSSQGQELFKQDLLASDLYRQVWCRKYDTALPNEYQHSPIIL
ncbi:MAG: nucleotidyltransferase family protein [Eubacterium sp.]|nr:nucleotidyltransferase family protein [Eubacterium sp.]